MICLKGFDGSETETRESFTGPPCGGGGLMCYKQWELYLGARFSLLGLFDLFDLAGFVHHFPVDHGLSDHLDDLPGANIRLFYRETVRVSPYCEGDTERDYYCYFFSLHVDV